MGLSGITVPMVLAAVGIVASVIGTFFVKTKEGASQKNLLSDVYKRQMVESETDWQDASSIRAAARDAMIRLFLRIEQPPKR